MTFFFCSPRRCYSFFVDPKLNKFYRPLTKRSVELNEHLRAQIFEMPLPCLVRDGDYEAVFKKFNWPRSLMQQFSRTSLPGCENDGLIDVCVRPQFI